jgi:hypothetical protein
MFSRFLKSPKHHDTFLFGERNTGKSTLLTKIFEPQDAYYFDRLDLDLEYQPQVRPNAFYIS